MAQSEDYTPQQIDQWLRAWTLLSIGGSRALEVVRADLEAAVATLDRNSPGHLAVEMRMKGSSREQIARALGVSNTRGARVLREAEEQMALGLRGRAPGRGAEGR